MKNILIIIILLVSAGLLLGADYYVNIYHAQDGAAEGEVIIKIDGFTVDQGSIAFDENFGNNVGGKYVARNLRGPGNGYIEVICNCRRKDLPLMNDSCSRMFSPQSATPYIIGTCDLGFPSPPPQNEEPGL